MNEFKVGDFVRNKHASHLISRIKSETENEYILENGFQHSKIDGCLELWQPKEGEPCWFWNQDTKIKVFGEFEKLVNCLGDCSFDNPYKKYQANVFWSEYEEEDFKNPGSSSFYVEHYEWEFAEPFFGELPSPK